MIKSYSISECANKLSELTEYNLELLQAINQSFYTKSSYVTTEIDGEEYNIPSFLYLENKIDELTNNFENLVNAPTTGQAAFSFDGDTQSIMLQGFQNSPSPVELYTSTNVSNLKVFDTENRDIFKDFTSPYIYTKLQLTTLPSHITEIDLKKITISNTDLRDIIGFGSSATSDTYANIQSILYNYVEDVDYVSYDTRYTLPTKVPDKSGEWTIKEIINTNMDSSSLVESIELYMNEDLTYKYSDQTLTDYIAVGDTLITYDDKCKFTVLSVDVTSKYLKLQVENGYINLASSTDSASQDMTTIKIFNEINTDIDSRTLKLPLEEDQYIIIFVAPVNSQLNVRAPWSDGLKIDVHLMRYQVDSGDSLLYESYYNTNIKNIGDVLYDISKFTSSTLSNIKEDTFDYISNYTPSLSSDSFTVTQINKHLFDNTDLDSIRDLSKSKAEINNRLLVIQNELTEIESTLSTTDFSNLPITTRTIYEDKQTELNTEKNTLTNTLINVANQITLSSNNTLIPTQDAKYSIIGYVDVDNLEQTIKNNIDDAAATIEIIKVNVVYRYKNYNNSVSGAIVVDDIFTYSNWNNLDTQYRTKDASWDDTTNTISYTLSEVNDNILQFNAIVIPICYGEQVDVKIQVQYSMGYPYINTVSSWSDTLSIEFPDSLVSDEDITDILDQNIKDTNTLDFKDLMLEDGVTEHVQNYVVDQDQTYFHKPESISSGFYTDDTRRIISLKDKLYEINTTLSTLSSYYNNDITNNLKIYLEDGISTITLSPNENNQTFVIPSYVDMDESDGYVTYSVNINLSNAGTTPINLYSLFHGDKLKGINDDDSIIKSKWYKYADEFNGTDKGGEYEKMLCVVSAADGADGADETTTSNPNMYPQYLNQFMYFRSKLPFSSEDILYSNNTSMYSGDFIITHPYITSVSLLQVSSAVAGSSYIIESGDNIVVPIRIKIKMSEGTSSDTISFSVWTSQYSEPISYTFNIKCTYDSNSTTDSNSTSSYTAIIS